MNLLMTFFIFCSMCFKPIEIDFFSPDFEEAKEMKITCYLPTGYKTASGQPTHIGGCAGRREDIGKWVVLYTKDYELVGLFEINDYGGHYMLRNGTALDIYRDNMDDAWEFIDTYGDHMYAFYYDSELEAKIFHDVP